jgi:hypothetical protein
MANYQPTMAVLGAPLYLGGDIEENYRYLCRLSIKNWYVHRFLVCSYLTMGSIHTKPSPYNFLKIVWGLPAGTEDHKN